MSRLTTSINGNVCYRNKICTLEDVLEKLYELEDKEEQGLLIEIPLKVGDTFWELNNALSEPFAYPRIAHSLSHVVYCMERLGKWCFLTEAEAEEALAKMGGK